MEEKTDASEAAKYLHRRAECRVSQMSVRDRRM